MDFGNGDDDDAYGNENYQDFHYYFIPFMIEIM